MNRILHWLTVKLSRPTAAETIEQPGSDYEERDFSKEDNPGELQPLGSGEIVAFPQVGGLHYRYERLAA